MDLNTKFMSLPISLGFFMRLTLDFVFKNHHAPRTVIVATFPPVVRERQEISNQMK